jgi:UDP-3-O-[3-hydroxymyristoyl] glucosamine N-acyltransferase
MYGLKDIERFFDTSVSVKGDEANLKFDNAKTGEEADNYSIVWFKDDNSEILDKLLQTKAGVVVCSSRIDIPSTFYQSKCFIQCEFPKLLYSRIVTGLFVTRINKGIHPTAIINEKAVIGEGTEIGAYTVIGNCVIGSDCSIGNNCHLDDNTVIGNNVIIGSCTVIGSCGYGYSRNEKGELELFPHIGGVIIEDDVEIGTNTSIDRGALGNTIIRKGSKIDNLVIIAHNVEVGEHSLVIGGAILCGSSKIGNACWIAPGACVRNGKTVGNNCTVGLGAIVTKDIPDGETWVGNPARPISVK